MADLKSLIINDTGNLTLPTGTTAQRPSVTSTVESFTTVGTTSWTCPADVTEIEVLVVAGGGGGGTGGGGGGAGGLIYNSSYPVTPGSSYIVTVGGGGSNTSTWGGAGTAGGNSVFGSLTAIGGGGGLHRSASSTDGTGGSGGGDAGGSGGYNTTQIIMNNGTPNQGHTGGSSLLLGTTAEEAGGGGGGAREPGQNSFYPRNASTNAGRAALPGKGGDGLLFSISGTPTFYAGGGGGSNRNGVGARGGQGGGGNGGTSPTAGVNGTGGGGGGTGYSGVGGGGTSGGGGSGIVIIRYTADSNNVRIRYNSETGRAEAFSKATWKPKTPSKNIATNGLVLYYDGAQFSSGSTKWIDLSGNGNDGTLTNSPTYDATTGSLVFNGSTQYVRAGSLGSWPRTGTVEFWMRSTSGTNYRNPFHSGFQDGNNGIRFEQDSTGRFTVIVGNTSSYSYADYCTTTNRLEENKWYHVVATWDTFANKVYGYLNGELKFILNNSLWATTFPSPTFGNGFSSSEERFFQGSIAVGRIYTRGLSGAEVQQNYNAEAGRFSAPPIKSYASAKELWREKPDIESGYYWIKPTGLDTAVLTYCDMETKDQFGESGWMLIGSWSQGYTWSGRNSPGNITIVSTIGTTPVNTVSSNFGNQQINMFRATATSNVETSLGVNAAADFYYYWKSSTTWKEVWAPGQGDINYYLSAGTTQNVVRCSIRKFDSSYNLKYIYDNPAHKYNNISDYGYQNTRVDLAAYSYGVTGGTTAGVDGFADFWTILTTPGRKFAPYYLSYTGNYESGTSPTLDGSLSIPISGAGTDSAGQDIDGNISVKVGVDDNVNWGGAATNATTNAGNNGAITTTPLWWWIK